MSDEPLTRLSEQEFMRLFVRHEPVLRAYAHAILPDWDCVDDALQEASVTMWEKRSQLRGEEGFVPWAKVIVRYKCLSIADTLRRDRAMLSRHVLTLLAEQARPVAAGGADVRQALEACLAEFSEAHQELLLAPYRGSGQVKRLAEQSGRTTNAVYKLLGRLREKIAACVRTRTQAVGA